MIGAVQLVPIARDPVIRQWCVFFCDGERFAWWDAFTPRGFRHVAAAGYSADLNLWIMFDPSRAGIRFEAYAADDPALDFRLGELLYHSGRRYLRVPVGDHRTRMPLLIGCVGALKALLGVRCGAFTPRGLFAHLIASGAELVTVPQPEGARVETIRRRPVDPPGGSEHRVTAPARAATG